MKKNSTTIRVLAMTFLVLPLTLACGLIPNFENIGGQVKEQIQQTVESISTQAVGDIQLTAEALGGEMGPVIEATLAALPNEVNVGEAPANIPVMPDPYGFFGSPTQVLYMTTATLDEAVQFYRQEMPLNGWQETEPGMVVAKAAYLNYVNDTQKATITMAPAGEKLAISITIADQ